MSISADTCSNSESIVPLMSMLGAILSVISKKADHRNTCGEGTNQIVFRLKYKDRVSSRVWPYHLDVCGLQLSVLSISDHEGAREKSLAHPVSDEAASRCFGISGELSSVSENVSEISQSSRSKLNNQHSVQFRASRGGVHAGVI